MNIVIEQASADDGRDVSIIVHDEFLAGLGFYSIEQEYDGIEVKPENIPALISALQKLIS